MVAHNCEFCMEKVSRAAARKYRCPPFLLRGMIRQVALLIVGVAMVGFGIMRGEADAVLAKAIRLCLECIGIG